MPLYFCGKLPQKVSLSVGEEVFQDTVTISTKASYTLYEKDLP
jgi:hypothetical protein